MANLSQLLSVLNPTATQAVAPQVYDPNVIPVGADIEVTAPNTRPESYQYDIQTPDQTLIPIQQAGADTSVLPRTEASPQEIARTQTLTGLPEHKGLFGIKGTLRNVLGTLGDALGGTQMFHDTAQRERLGDAMIGFDSANPDEAMAAIARVAQVNPQAAQQLSQQYQQRVNQVAQQDIARQRAIQDQQVARQKAMYEGVKYYAQALSGMSKDNYDPQLLSDIAQQAGLPAGFLPPAAFDQKWADRLVAYGTPRNTQISESMGERKQNEAERHNQASEAIARTRANRPPAARAAPNPTNASLAAGILGKVERGEPLTQGQQEYLNRLGYPANRGQGKARSPLVEKYLGKQNGATGGGGKLVFRNGKLVPAGQ